MPSRHGVSLGPSVVIGMAVFVITVGASLILMQNTVQPGGSFADQAESAAWDAYNAFQVETHWTVYRQPVFVRTSAAKPGHPIEVQPSFPAGTVPESILVLRNGNELASDHNRTDNTTVFTADLNAGLNRFDVLYTTEGNMDDRQYSNGLSSNPTAVWHDRLNVSTAASGISQIQYRDLDMFAGTAAMGGTGTPTIDARTVRANVSYSDMSFRVFNDSGHIRVRREASGTEQWVFNLSTNFSQLYVEGDGTQALSGNGTFFQGTTDFIDVSDAYGVGFIHPDMTVNVSKRTDTSPTIVNITVSQASMVVLVHDGNHSTVLPEFRGYRDGKSPVLGMPVEQTGISRQKAAALASLETDSIEDKLGLTETNFNITVNNTFSAGTRIDGDEVANFSFQTIVLGRFGNATVQPFDIRVWP